MKRKIFGSKYVQIIDDNFGNTILSYSTIKMKNKSGTKLSKCFKIGIYIGLNMKKLNIKKAIFNRGKYIYHGLIKSVIEGIKKTGIII